VGGAGHRGVLFQSEDYGQVAAIHCQNLTRTASPGSAADFPVIMIQKSLRLASLRTSFPRNSISSTD
jgi:hypothetical protein